MSESKKVADWPYRWDLLLRYRMIEIIAMWEGRLTSKHLQQAFGIGRQQASKDINEYKTNIAPENLAFDSHLKGYIPTKNFQPLVTKGDINEYLHMLNSRGDLMTHFADLNIHQANTEVLSPLVRNINAAIVRPILTAARDRLRVEVEYSSLTSEKEYRNIVPHTLVYNGYRWHVRAFCEKTQSFRDFVLSRITAIFDFVGPADLAVEDDKAWCENVQIIIRPDQRLTPHQQAVIAADYGMTNNQLIIESRGAMVQYQLQFLRVSTDTIKADPKAQQVVIDNIDEIKPWLFKQ